MQVTSVMFVALEMAPLFNICFWQDEGEDSEAEVDEDGEEEEKITRNWSVLKSTPDLRKSKVCTYTFAYKPHAFCPNSQRDMIIA